MILVSYGTYKEFYPIITAVSVYTGCSAVPALTLCQCKVAQKLVSVTFYELTGQLLSGFPHLSSAS